MSTVKLESVQKTLLLPLWGRAFETRKVHPLLVDRAAADLMAAIDDDFSTIANNISVISQLAWIARSVHTDRTIRGFLANHPEAMIVNLGCGLDTTFDCVDNGCLLWYDLDLADVIELRRRHIPVKERVRLISGSLLDDIWMRHIEAGRPIFFIASGVLYYFEEAQVKTLLMRLAHAFPGCELLFDACSPYGMRVANRKVIRACGVDESAVLKWSLRSARDLKQWERRIEVVAEYPLFRDMQHGLSIGERWGTLLSDLLGIMSMVHLRLGSSSLL